MQIFKRFLLQELFFTVLVATVALILFKTVLAAFYLPVFWILLGIIAVLTAIFHFSIIQMQDKGASKFAARFMMVSGIKMMIYLIVITLYAFLFTEKAKVFLISFFTLYLLYTAFEVYLIVRHIRKQDKNHV